MKYTGIKVNIITGFLGSGKTTAIRHFLTQVPAGENWAVLVNEFGEIGLDGDLLAGLDPHSGHSIAIKQVPGGCLCCTTSAAFGAGLNELIKTANPTRIIIEPTGIGHPDQILKQLEADHYQGVLDIRASLCLLDARNLDNPRYVGHPAFFDQINMADVLVATKQDLYQEGESGRFLDFAKQFSPAKSVIALVENGQMDAAWLDAPRIHQQHNHHDHHDHHDHAHVLTSQPKPGVTYYQRRDTELASHGWIIDNPLHITIDQLRRWAGQTKSLDGFWRLKGIVQLSNGTAWQFNLTSSESDWIEIDEIEQSRVEYLVAVESEAPNLPI